MSIGLMDRRNLDNEVFHERYQGYLSRFHPLIAAMMADEDSARQSNYRRRRLTPRRAA